MDNFPHQPIGFPPNGATIGMQPQIFFAGGVNAPETGIYQLTPAPPGGLSSLGPRLTRPL